MQTVDAGNSGNPTVITQPSSNTISAIAPASAVAPNPNVPAGYGVPGSPYSKAIAAQTAPSAMQTRQHDNGDGTYTWQELDSVSGQWTDMGRAQPYPQKDR